MTAPRNETSTSFELDGKPFRIVIPSGRTSYYLIHRQTEDKKESITSLGTDHHKSALAIAKKRARAIIDKDLEFLTKTVKKRNVSTIGEIADAYMASAAIGPGRKGPLKSAQDNVWKFYRVVEISQGLTQEVEWGKSNREATRAESSAILDGKLVSKYLRNAAAAGYSSHTVYSMLTGARCLFAHRGWIRECKLPSELEKFLHDETAVRDDSDLEGEPLDAATVAKMDQETFAAREILPALWRAYALCRYLGLRPGEASETCGAWFTREEEGLILTVCNRTIPYEFTVKNGRTRRLLVSDWLAPYFEELRPEEYAALDHKAPTVREKHIGRTLSTWVRKYIPDRTKSVYELRKLAGSDVLNSTKNWSLVALFLGDTVETVRRYYARWRIAAPSAASIMPVAPGVQKPEPDKLAPSKEAPALT